MANPLIQYNLFTDRRQFAIDALSVDDATAYLEEDETLFVIVGTTYCSESKSFDSWHHDLND